MDLEIKVFCICSAHCLKPLRNIWYCKRCATAAAAGSRLLRGSWHFGRRQPQQFEGAALQAQDASWGELQWGGEGEGGRGESAVVGEVKGGTGRRTGGGERVLQDCGAEQPSVKFVVRYFLISMQ